MPTRATSPAETLGELAEALVAVSARMVRDVGRASHLPVSITQARVLVHLSEAGPLRVTQLAHRERCAQPSMTALVSRLEAAGYVERMPDAEDGRATRIAATAAGLDQLRLARREMAAELGLRLNALDRDDQDCLRRAVGLLDRLTNRDEDR